MMRVFFVYLYPTYNTKRMTMSRYALTNVSVLQLYNGEHFITGERYEYDTHWPLINVVKPLVSRRIEKQIRLVQAAYGCSGAFQGSSSREMPCLFMA